MVIKTPYSARKTLIGLALLLLVSCSPARSKVTNVTPPPQPAPRQLEMVQMPVSGDLQIREHVEPLDPVGLAILEARLQLELTQEQLKAMREADGFSWGVDQHAAIDDIGDSLTLPSSIDPAMRKAIEDQVKGLTHDLPLEINDRVLGFLEYYRSGRGRTTMAAGLERVGRWRPMIEQILQEEGVPLDLIYLCQAESAFLPRALSRAKAKGMWQFIASRGKEYGLRQNYWIDERSDPEKSTRAAARHLKDLYSEFGDWYLAMAAYNAGPGRIQNALRKTGASDFWTLANNRALPRETINYVPTILALTIIGKNPAQYGFDVAPEPALETERVAVGKATDLRVIAEAVEIPVEDLKQLNAHVLRWTTPPDDPEFELVLPLGYANKFNEVISALPDSKRLLYREHVVKKGDTLGAIAKKYGSSVADLTEANRLGRKSLLRIGQALMIPLSGPAATKAAASRLPQSTASRLPKPDKSPTSYTVRRGDTLGKIAARFAVTINAIRSWNKRDDLKVLHPGDRLTIFAAEK